MQVFLLKLFIYYLKFLSHPLFGIEQNGVEGVKIAAKRKLFHELGIDSVDVGDMHVMGRFIYLARSDSIWVEHELDYAIL